MPQWDVLTFDMEIHGWIALVLALIGVTGLHLGLMWLARKRHDDGFRPEERSQRTPWSPSPPGGRAPAEEDREP